MKIITKKQELRTLRADLNKDKQTLCLVPTMGALHEGHLSLIDLAHKKADKVIVSIFVNPTQFGEGEDFDAYPRDLDKDSELAGQRGTDYIYAPSVKEIYPNGFATKITMRGITEPLCGASRPGHFDGVCTIVTKLFLQTKADYAVFGEKDFQQLQVIRTLVRDLDLPIDIIAAPISREDDGLARSSRNRYLSQDERLLAPFLHKILQELAKDLKSGKAAAPLLEKAIETLKTKGFKPDYLTLLKETNLTPIKKIDGHSPARLFVAAYLGKTRLIDNLKVV